MRMSSKLFCATALSVFSWYTLAHAKAEIKSRIVYVSGITIYIDAGRLRGITLGDTAKIVHSGIEAGTAVITAIADSSGAMKLLSRSGAISIGDTVEVLMGMARLQPGSSNVDTTRFLELQATSKSSPKQNLENTFSGRAALQYYYISAEDTKFDLRQPGAMLMLDVSNLFGTGMVLSLDDRSFYDASNNYSLYGNATGFEHYLYQASLTRNLPEAAIGYGIGRITSQFVGGIGTFDGAQLYYRIGEFTAGILGGAAADVPSSLNFNGTRSAFFLNYHSGSNLFHQYDGTIAYGLQLVGGILDRNFLDLQNSLSIGPELSIYETTEIDMSQLSDGARKTAFNFSNTFLSANYFPSTWLFVNIGYDASRNIYLFQSMKNIPDSLIDRNVLQGYRASATTHLPWRIVISATATFDTRRDYSRDEHTVGGSARVSDILGTDINAGGSYLNMVGVFSNGRDYSASIDRAIFERIEITLRYDSYNISVETLQQSYKTQTFSGILSIDLSSRLYLSTDLNYVLDATMNSVTAAAEVGYRF